VDKAGIILTEYRVFSRRFQQLKDQIFSLVQYICHTRKLFKRQKWAANYLHTDLGILSFQNTRVMPPKLA